MNKIITVDIGNSNIVVGIWEGQTLEFTGRLETRRDYTEDELTSAFKELIRNNSNNGIYKQTDKQVDMQVDIHVDKQISGCCEDIYDGAILSSVVPEITDQMMAALKNITGKEPLLMSSGLKTGIDISSYATGSIGMDRIVDLSAAVAMYGAPVMTVDLGTCTTITVAGMADTKLVKAEYIDVEDDCASSDAEYKGKLVGGMICPGIQLSLDAQAQRASQLPQLEACGVDSLLGTDTASNMMSGVVAGCGLMISELADRLVSGDIQISVNKESVSTSGDSTNVDFFANDIDMSNLKVVITGGLGKLVIPWINTKADVYYEPDLLLRGLYEIYINNTLET
ncbi:type III pantothenate kinase [Butyrivibrio sp. VCB2006]|uniref:type III pantothenate kinase n=1 Tax=Butyrivibrio sp. VCB2006 TaxID=1280679 RepID=UPI00040DAAF3|nr:type III pantothenate kinase [Butyrivibrio sp. VCB2006]